jgi:hypothetical protein
LRVTDSQRSIVVDSRTCGVSQGSGEEVVMMVGRRGQDDFCLMYPAFDVDDAGRTRFVLDDKLFALPDGRYEAHFVQGCATCAVVELVIDKDCAIDVSSIEAVEGIRPKISNGEIPDVSDIFDQINELELELCSVLEPTADTLPLSVSDKEMLCALTLCCPVQLLVTDGVKSEYVAFEGCEAGEVKVARGANDTTPSRFPAGSELCFTWTPDNVRAAAEGCL